MLKLIFELLSKKNFCLKKKSFIRIFNGIGIELIVIQ